MTQCTTFDEPLATFINNLPRVEHSKPIVVYTAVMNDYDRLTSPPQVESDVEYICFTNSSRPQPPGWKVIRNPALHRDPRRTARVYKMMPHRLFPNATTTLWVDGTCVIKGSPAKLVREYAGDGSPGLTCFPHPEWSRVQDERVACLRGMKDDPVLIQAQAEAYAAAGFPDSSPLVATGVLLRRNLDPSVIALNEDWLKEIDTYSSRDQLSFNFVAWRRAFVYGLFPMSLGKNDFCGWRPHPRLAFYDRNAEPMYSLRSIIDSIYGRVSYKVRSVLGL